MSDVIQTASNVIGDIYTYVHADGIHSLHVYDAVSHQVSVTVMRFFPLVNEWTNLYHCNGETETVSVRAELGQNIVAEWADTKKYADAIVNM